jgi:hypothetical protein
MRRPLGLLVLLGAIALLAAGAGHAHTTGIHTGFVATISGVDPPLPGLLVRVVGGHERLSVRNWTERTVVLFNEQGGVVARLAPGDGRAWADPRIDWEGPPPEGETRLRTWRIEGEADGERFAIAGFLGYRPPAAAAAEELAPDSGWPAWATIAVVVGGGILAAAALALPLVRRKGEGVRP